MAQKRTPETIASRFTDEQAHIAMYIGYLLLKSSIQDQQVFDLNRVLKRNKISPLLPVRAHERTLKPFAAKELTQLVTGIDRVSDAVEDSLRACEPQLARPPGFTLAGPAAPFAHLLGEWIDYLMSVLPEDADEEDVEGICEHAVQEAERMGDNEAPPEATRILIRDAVEHVRHIRVERREDALLYVQSRFREIKLLARVAAPGAEINLLRQGFILLMTAFDAAVFDLVRAALRKRFFELISAFGKQEKVTLQEIGEAGSLGVLREQIIEDQLKRRYIKDLLFLLDGLGVKCVDEAAGAKFAQLIELVLRRNLHVHNRGVVDERYLDRDQHGNPRYNLYNLRAGQLAPISEAYWDMANDLCAQAVQRIAAWAAA